MSTRIMALCWPLQMSPTQKSVLISLADQANDSGVCWPSIATIALRTCLSDRTVRRSIRELEEGGYLHTNSRSGTSSSYVITPDTVTGADRVTGADTVSITPDTVTGGGGQSDRGPRTECPPNRKEPSLKRKEPSTRAKKISLPKPENVSESVWADFVAHRQQMKSALTERAAQLIARKIKQLSPAEADRALEESIENGWKGVFPNSKQGGGRVAPNKNNDIMAGVI